MAFETDLLRARTTVSSGVVFSSSRFVNHVRTVRTATGRGDQLPFPFFIILQKIIIVYRHSTRDLLVMHVEEPVTLIWAWSRVQESTLLELLHMTVISVRCVGRQRLAVVVSVQYHLLVVSLLPHPAGHTTRNAGDSTTGRASDGRALRGEVAQSPSRLVPPVCPPWTGTSSL